MKTLKRVAALLLVLALALSLAACGGGKTETPKTEEPKAETPKADTPKTETPKAEEPKTDAPAEPEKSEKYGGTLIVSQIGQQYEDNYYPPKAANADILQNIRPCLEPLFEMASDGTLISFLDRLFYSLEGSLHMKVGAAVVSCRRGGASASFDVLNKYFTISGMPVASSTYWNSVHGFTAADVEKDLEGLQTVRNIAHNMAFLIRSIAAQKEEKGLPVEEHGSFTSFPDGK